jgi:hypothetical protein
MAENSAADVEEILQRMCAEYLEMPGLCLTHQQAQRLWGLDEQTCVQLLNVLVDTGFLHERGDGTYVRVTEGPVAPLRFRMLKAVIGPGTARSRVGRH